MSYPTGSVLTLVAYGALVVLSLPCAGLGSALARRYDPFRVAAGVLGLLGVATLGAVAWLWVAFGVSAAVLLELLVAWLAVAVGPVVVAAGAVRRFGPAARERAWRLALGTWPLGTVASAVVFVAPGGVSRYNVTFLSGTAAAVAIGALFLALWGLPAIVGTLVVRRADARRG